MKNSLTKTYSQVFLASLVGAYFSIPTLSYSLELENFIQQAKLVSTGGNNPDQGWSVSVSRDGNTLAIGGPFNNDAIGTAWVFNRSNATWLQQAQLVGANYIGSAPYQGWSVSLSNDGTTLAVGGQVDDYTTGKGAIGATWVFVYSGTTWTQQAKLVGTNVIGDLSSQGFSVSLSGDGNTLAVGGPYDDGSPTNGGVGAVWIFVRSGTTWTQQSKLVGINSLGYALQGWSVALSSDGSTLAVGGPYDNGNPYEGYGIGAVWVFVRSGTTWTQQAKLVGSGSDYPNEPFQGWSVALSANGTTLAVGGPADRAGGATWIFSRLNSTWTEQAKLTGTDIPYSSSEQGSSVSLSENGNILASGGPDSGDIGAVWLFTRSGTTWSQQDRLSGTQYIGDPKQGYSVSLSADGATLAFGGPFDNKTSGGTGCVGGTWVFVNESGN